VGNRLSFVSSNFAGPKATTLPLLWFSLAVSGMMIPPFYTSCLRRRLHQHAILRAAVCLVWFFFFYINVAISCCYHSFGGCCAGGLRKFPEAADQKCFVISSCRRQRLRRTLPSTPSPSRFTPAPSSAASARLRLGAPACSGGGQPGLRPVLIKGRADFLRTCVCNSS